MKYIYHHLGLGDHIICNSLVRHYQTIYGEISVFCKIHNYENVKYMFRDNGNINVLSIGEDVDILNYIHQNNILNDVIKIGFGGEYHPNITSFDEGFYLQHNLPFSSRFSNFYFERNSELESEIYQKLNPDNEKFIFCHGDIDKSKIRKDLKIIENPTEYSIFNLLLLFENAEEIHLMESSIKCLINSYTLNKPKLFYHKYVRGYSNWNNTEGLNNFTIVE